MSHKPHSSPTVAAGRPMTRDGGGDRPRALEQADVSPAAASMPASPAALVGVGSGAVPFVDHAGVLGGLVRSCDVGEQVALHVLTGPSGAGKTHTATRWCQEMRGRRWLAGLLRVEADAGALEELASSQASLAVVVDNAETRVDQLATLIPALTAKGQRGWRAQLVLTMRPRPSSGDWREWLRATSGIPDVWLGRSLVYDLAERPADLAARQQIFQGALRAFASYLSLPLIAAEEPVTLDQPLFSKPLLVVIAAYLSVHGQKPPDSEQKLLDCLIDEHEDQYWRTLAIRQQPQLSLGKTARRRIAAFASLAGADNEAEAVRLLALLNDSELADPQDRVAAARWAAQLNRGPRYWNRLQSDTIAEHLVAAASIDDAAVLRVSLNDRRPGSLTSSVGLLARAAAGRPDLGAAVSTVLDQHLGPWCDQAAAAADPALGFALTSLVQTCPPNPARLPAILDGLPPGPEFAVTPLAAVLTQQAEGYFRRLAETDPRAYLPNLAIASNNLSVRLADLGRRDEAAVAISEAVRLFRRLARSEPAAHQTNFVISLHNYWLRLTELGRCDEAAAAVAEAVGLYRGLAEADPERYRPKLAATLSDMSERLAGLGRKETARAAITEATRHFRQLADANPVHLPDLATSLEHLAVRLCDLGLRKEAAIRRSEAQAALRAFGAHQTTRRPPSTSQRIRRAYRRS